MCYIHSVYSGTKKAQKMLVKLILFLNIVGVQTLTNIKDKTVVLERQIFLYLL